MWGYKLTFVFRERQRSQELCTRCAFGALLDGARGGAAENSAIARPHTMTLATIQPFHSADLDQFMEKTSSSFVNVRCDQGYKGRDESI
jgi:hypothetical protein